LPDRVALVTGGGRGVGADVARGLAAGGWSVVVAARTRDEIEAVARETGGRALELDVGSATSIERAFADAGPIDLLVNNAGVTGPSGPSWLLDSDDWWRVLEVNVRGAFLCARAVIPAMRERGGGRIVNVGSGAAYLGTSRATSAYGASKAALHRFGELLAGELEPFGIAVFEVCPGLVRSRMTEELPDDSPWAPPGAAAAMIRALASGGYDALAGLYLHAEWDDLDDLLERLEEVREGDLHQLRLLRRGR
jgi:NAD(P)-dependent dehydrogenase (short-subunit alcohol dehydrogenase family)